MSDLFHYKNNISLRSHSNKELSTGDKPRLEFCKKSLSYSGPKIWNKIPLHIRQTENLVKFKKMFLAWWYSGGQEIIYKVMDM